MDIVLLLLLLLIFLVLLFALFRPQKNELLEKYETKIEILEEEKNTLLEEKARLRADMENKSEEVGKLTALLEKIKSEKDQLEGKGKQVFVENTRLSEELTAVREKNKELAQLVEQFRARERQKEEIFEEKIKKLEHAQKSLEDEKARIRREDEERQAQQIANRDRMWNEHETRVLSALRDACQKPEIAFSFYENTNLPTDFDGSFKPDFLIDFLGQYLYFDAKVSRANLQNYLADQAKKTAAKLKKNPQIYSHVFFVVPSTELAQLKKTVFYEGNYTFFVLSPESIEPILANFKRITEYDQISEFDPKDRETIVNIIANYDKHIAFQNATNILLAKKSIPLMNEKEKLGADMQKEIAIRKQTLSPIKLKDSEIKKMSQHISTQEQEIENLTSPRAALPKEDMHQAEQLFS